MNGWWWCLSLKSWWSTWQKSHQNNHVLRKCRHCVCFFIKKTFAFSCPLWFLLPYPLLLLQLSAKISGHPMSLCMHLFLIHEIISIKRSAGLFLSTSFFVSHNFFWANDQNNQLYNVIFVKSSLSQQVVWESTLCHFILNLIKLEKGYTINFWLPFLFIFLWKKKNERLLWFSIIIGLHKNQTDSIKD